MNLSEAWDAIRWFFRRPLRLRGFEFPEDNPWRVSERMQAVWLPCPLPLARVTTTLLPMMDKACVFLEPAKFPRMYRAWGRRTKPGYVALIWRRPPRLTETPSSDRPLVFAREITFGRAAP